MSLFRNLGRLYQNEYVNMSGQSQEERKEALTDYILRIENSTSQAVRYNDWTGVRYDTQAGTVKTETGNSNSMLYSAQSAEVSHVYGTISLDGEGLPAAYSFKMHFDALKNKHSLFDSYTANLRWYTASNAYNTISKNTFFSLFDEWLIFDYTLFNEALSAHSKYTAIGAYSNDALVNNDKCFSIEFNYNGEKASVPFIFSPQGNVNQGYESGSNLSFLGRRYMYRPFIDVNGCRPQTWSTAMKDIINIYAAEIQNKEGHEVDYDSSDLYVLRGNKIYRFTNTSGSYEFYLIHKDVVDAFIIDFKAATGIDLIYSGNIPAPTPPGPEPGDAEETAPGQPDNVISNQGGTGDFSSDGILDQQTGATATTSYAGTTYCLNRAAFRDVKKDLWDANYLTLIKDLFGSGQNTIINCLLFPFNITGITTNPIAVSSIFLGTHEVELQSPSAAYALGSGSRAEVTIGPLTGFQKVLGGFLDDNGVTECYIHLPFIGMQQIDPEIIYGHTVSVKYIFDYMTGECQALIYSNMATAADGQTYTSQAVCCYEFSGQAGIPIGFSESNLNSLILNVGVNALKGAFQGGAAGAGTALVEGAMSVIGAPAAHMEGATGSSIERMKSLDVYLMFIRPKTVIPNTYNKTKGRPSGISAALSSLTGFTVIDNPIIQTTATQTEKDIIINKLKEGVRIK